MKLTSTPKLYYLTAICILLSFSSVAQKKKAIKKMLDKSEIVQSQFTGFALYDEEKREMIYSLNEDKYFSPASNTKLLTFYTAMEMLGDSIPGLKYVVRGDSLIFWGTGDPTFLHHKLKTTKIVDFLKAAPQKLFFSAYNYEGNFYGRSWPYGDYNAYYQAEISSLPVYGNLVKFKANPNGPLSATPRYFESQLHPNTKNSSKNLNIRRELESNKFNFNEIPITEKLDQSIPWKTSPELTVLLLQDTLNRYIQIVDIPLPKDAKTIYTMETDSVLKELMLPSDNFIAEQLLLVCSTLLGDKLSTPKAIQYSQANFFKDLSHPFQWADGSGLSRSNLFTPKSIIELLIKIKAKVNDEERLHSLLPAGGLAGTLRSAYKTDPDGKAFVWAKTGTLNAVHNQSGYIITKKGKRLIYSFMNNNYVRPTAEVRNEMVRIVTEIHDKY